MQSSSAKTVERGSASTEEPNVFVDLGAALFGATLDAGAATISAVGDVLATDEAGSSSRTAVDASKVATMDVELGEIDVDEATPEAMQEVAEADATDMDMDMDGVPFIAAAKFEGAKPGFTFRLGPEGKGYYNRDYVWE